MTKYKLFGKLVSKYLLTKIKLERIMIKEKLSTEERKIQISEIALKIIADEGLKKMTANSIANKLGVSDSTIFKHFKNKEEIIRSAIDRFEEILNSCYPDQEEKDPLERLGSFLMKRMKMVRKYPEIIKLVFNEKLTDAECEESKERVQKIVSDSINFIINCLNEAKETKKISIVLPSKIIVWMIIGILHGASQTNKEISISSFSDNSSSNYTPSKLWEEIKNFLTGKTKI